MVAGPDLNRRPSGYEPDELPGCSTPRLKRGKFYSFWVKMQILLGFGVPRRDVKSAGIIVIHATFCQRLLLIT